MTGDETRAGNYFVSNYPPFSVWSPEAIGAVDEQLEAAPAADVPLGLYIHLPFCRKRCDFCYFKVYTDKSSADIRTYLDALARELLADEKERAEHLMLVDLGRNDVGRVARYGSVEVPVFMTVCAGS